MTKPKRGRSTAAIDDHVGARIRERRIMLGLTQQQLAEMIGVTYQQAHKYERGINRVSAGRLYEIARVLNAPVVYFYEGLGQAAPQPATPHQRMLLEDRAQLRRRIQNEKHQEARSATAGPRARRALTRHQRSHPRRHSRRRDFSCLLGAEPRIELFYEPQ